MKPAIICMMLAMACIKVKTYAQNAVESTVYQSQTESVFNPLNENDPLRHKFNIYLNNGNKVIVELNSMELLKHVYNIDSIIQSVLKDITQLKDPLQDETNNKKIEIVIDSNNLKKIRFTTFKNPAKTYLIDNGEPAALKIEQDTLTITKFYNSLPRKGRRVTKVGEWKITVIVNNLDDINAYTKGILNSTIQKISTEFVSKADWKPKRDRKLSVEADYYPLDKAEPGRSNYYDLSYKNFFLGIGLLNYNLGIQNIGSAITPFTSLRYFDLNFNRKNIKRTFSLRFETLFFQKINSDGEISFYTNGLIDFVYTRKTNHSLHTNKREWKDYSISFGFVLNDSASRFKNTFRVALPNFIKFSKSLSLTPQFYFYYSFREIFPSLKVSVSL